MKKPIILIGILIILVAGYALWVKDRGPERLSTDPYETTLSGTIDCLQPKDPSLPGTADCKMALKTDTGDYYALNFQTMTMPYPTPIHGARLTAQGLVTPIENLSSDQWQRYNVKGIFSVQGDVRQEAAK